MHQRDHAFWILFKELFELLQVYLSLLIDVEEAELHLPFFGQHLQGVEYRMVLEGRGNGMADTVRFDATDQGGIVCLGASRSKENFGWAGMDKFSHLFTSLLNGRSHLSAVAMYRGRIAKLSSHKWQHRFDHAIVHRGGGGIVEVYVLHRMHLGEAIT